MNDKCYNNLLKILLIFVGATIVIVTLFLYLGDCEMKRVIKDFLCDNCFKIFVTLGIIFLIVLWCYPCKKSNFVTHDALSIRCDKSVLVIGKENTNGNISYFDTIDKACANALDGDTIYIWVSEGEISLENLQKISETKNLTFKFMSPSEIAINKKSENNSNQKTATEE